MEQAGNKTDSKIAVESKKGDIAREKILDAARRVFSRHPYHEASLRMIAKEGGFDHPLIRYYFPSKADLFGAVVAEVVDEFYAAHFVWMKGLDLLPPGKGLALLIERIVDHHYESPNGMRIIMQNISRTEALDAIPGYPLIPQLLAVMRSNFRQKVLLSGPEAEIGQFFASLFVTIVLYLGASSTTAQFLGLDHAGPHYRAWLKSSLVFQFLPWLTRLSLPTS